MLVRRILVPVDAKVTSIMRAAERLQDRPTRQASAFTLAARQGGSALRKDLFAEAMLENSPTRPPRRGADLVVSATAHAVLLAVLLLLPLYFTEAINFHQLNETLLVAPPAAPAPPPPPTSVAVARSVAPRKRTLAVMEKFVMPRVIPNHVARPSEEPGGSDLVAGIVPFEGVPGGVPGGQPGGVVGGVLSGASPNYLPPVPLDSAPKGPIRVGRGVKAPRLIFGPEPVYPVLARQARIAGAVVIDAVIDTQGNVVEMRTVSGQPILALAAMEALRHWKYEPTILGGEAFPVQLLVTITFEAKNRQG